MSKKNQSDGRAGLGIIRIIRQIVVLRKRFSGRSRTDSAGQIHLLCSHIIPQPSADPVKFLVLRLCRKISHRRVHIHGSHRMANRRLLLPDRCMKLIVIAIRIVIVPLIGFRNFCPVPESGPSALFKLLLKKAVRPSGLQKI